MQTRQTLEQNRQQIEEVQQQPSVAKIGGFPWSYLPTINRDAWLNKIRDLRYPEEDLASWIEFNKVADEIAAKHIDAHVYRVLDSFTADGGADAIVLDNLPVDPKLGPTPIDGNRPPQKKAVSELVMAGLIRRMKRQIISYRQEKEGAPFQQLVPIVGEEAKQSNTGRAKFGYHTDNANFPSRFRQEGLALFGLRNEKDIATIIITLDQIKEGVPAEIISKLRFPIYVFPNPLSFNLGGWSTLSEPRPIIRTDDNGIDRIALPRSEFEQPNIEANDTIKEFRNALDQLVPHRVVLSPGRFLAFKDSRVLHGRDTVLGDRWIERVYFSASLDQHRRATKSDPRWVRLGDDALRDHSYIIYV